MNKILTDNRIIDITPQKFSILIAEDNLVNQKLAIQILTKKGYQAEAVGNGKEVLEILEKKKFDLILMDIQMPVLDGFAATAAIREKESNVHVPIVALTAHATENYNSLCVSAGMDGYLSKPFEVKKLIEVVEHFLKKDG